MVIMSLLDRHHLTSKLLCVANAHLCWDPRSPDLKAIQVRDLGLADQAALFLT
jgi:mRNA deadenylase 3'-5' endonuclease subunit Ccr4